MKRAIAILLACLLLCGFMPLMAGAADGAPTIVVTFDQNGYPILTCNPPPESADTGELRYFWYYKEWDKEWLDFVWLLSENPLHVADWALPKNKVDGLPPDSYQFRCYIKVYDGTQLVQYGPPSEPTDWLKLPGADNWYWSSHSKLQWFVEHVLFGWLWMPFLMPFLRPWRCPGSITT